MNLAMILAIKAGLIVIHCFGILAETNCSKKDQLLVVVLKTVAIHIGQTPGILLREILVLSFYA